MHYLNDSFIGYLTTGEPDSCWS